MPDGTVRQQVNPARKLGSVESIARNGVIFREISNELEKMNIVATKTVNYENINTELLKINPNVDIDPKSGIEE